VEYRVLFSYTDPPPNPHPPLPGDPLSVGDDDATPQVHYRGEIRSEAEYVDAFGSDSGGIDWTMYRVVAVQLTTIYKLGALETSENLTSIRADDSAIYLTVTATHHGPCQGIAQLSEWFSYQQSTLYVLLPNIPEPVSHLFCLVGGCPPDIP